MADVIAAFSQFVPARGGTLYAARVHGRPLADGQWEGWLEFQPFEGAPAHFTPRETTQPSRDALAEWARHLSRIWLEGALERAVNAEPPAEPDAPGTRAAPIPPPAPALHAVLDPFAVFVQGEEVLRRELSALSVDHLVTIVRAYELDEGDDTLDDSPTHAAQLVARIMAGVKSRLGVG